MRARRSRIAGLLAAALAGSATVAAATAATFRRPPPEPAFASLAPARPSASTPGRPRWDLEEISGITTGIALRPMDRDILDALASGHVTRAEVTDVFPDRPYAVRLFGSAATQQFRFVLVDLDRDGRWDERWDLGEAGQVRRQTGDVGEPGEPEGPARDRILFTLSHGRWQAH